MKKSIEVRPLCKSSGVICKGAICGKVSVACDKKGHRCMAHGNVKCKHKVKTATDSKGITYEIGGQYVDTGTGLVCFLDFMYQDNTFRVHDGCGDWTATGLTNDRAIITTGRIWKEA